MPGVPGRSGGSNRKRSEQKLGHAKAAQSVLDHHGTVDKPEAGPVDQPELVFPDFDDGSPWVPSIVTRDLWDSMAVSGFHEYYTMADWSAARAELMVVDGCIRDMLNHNGALSSMKAAEMRSALGELMVFESARRRLKIEVQRHKDTVAPLAAVAPIDRAKASGL